MTEIPIEEAIQRYPTIKRETLEGLYRYVKGTPTGSFLRAVLSNDLKESIGRADESNAASLKEIVCFIYYEMPSQCQGSEKAVNDWLAGGYKND